MKFKTFRIGGVHPEENKLSSESVTQVAGSCLVSSNIPCLLVFRRMSIERLLY